MALGLFKETDVAIVDEVEGSGREDGLWHGSPLELDEAEEAEGVEDALGVADGGEGGGLPLPGVVVCVVQVAFRVFD